MDEAAKVAAHFQRANLRNGRKDLTFRIEENKSFDHLRGLLVELRPRVVHFIGHGDVSLGTTRTLGFTAASGQLERMTIDTIAKAFSSARATVREV